MGNIDATLFTWFLLVFHVRVLIFYIQLGSGVVFSAGFILTVRTGRRVCIVADSTAVSITKRLQERPQSIGSPNRLRVRKACGGLSRHRLTERRSCFISSARRPAGHSAPELGPNMG